MTKIKYALIGCGRIAPNHLAAALSNGLDIVAVCDMVPEHMEKVLQQVAEAERGNIHRYTDYKQLLKEEKPDLVAIATESGKHAGIGLDVLQARCHAIIEKPIALSIQEADRLIDTADKYRLVLCACHQNRFNKSVQKIREALEAGRFGRLMHGAAHIRWNRGRDYYAQAPWRGTWQQDGGALMNQCIHNIDLLRWMMGGEIEEVFAYTDRLRHPYIEAEDFGMALVRFKNGSYGLIEGTTNIFPSNLEETLYIFGEKGTVKAGGKSVNILEEWLFADGMDDPQEIRTAFRENPPNVYGFGHTPLYGDVCAAIREGRKPYIDGKAGKDALELVLAIYKSAREGRPVKLPLEDFSTLDMIGSFQND
jgi:UDP-N-acetyl-2-amino-2-deoxyglucuronate dehydrogenase